ncbi:acyclic terpene utilization AtuA family protein [Thalassovita sp.]|uniref:acyclic terpene utilization AtuA family protein n=1 Tax=Thalassovita sp. TaxID=1979401 RepID=UPI002AAF62BB|nr:acyclic terpene utilization AtuA family protein [Thalassovita sp.]
MTKVLVPAGVLGLGFDPEALERGLSEHPDIICIDGGSTDSGPFYLGTGTSKYSRAANKAEWKQLMQARAKAGVPLVIGSAGTCGSDSTVEWMYQITTELAAELGQSLKIARLYSSQPAERVVEALDKDRITPLDPAPEISAETLAQCSNIVALAGAEQIGAALATGADIVIAGRTTDTATVAALPLINGDHAGGAWHGAKIAECGALCSTMPTSGVIMVEFDKTGFTVTPMAEGARCTPHSVSAHMLYENSDPFQLYEPGGHLDVTAAQYTALNDRQVRVEGGTWVPSDRFTVKLEGARMAGYQATIMAMLRAEHYVKNAREWAASLEAFVRNLIATRMELNAEDYDLEFRLIGVNSVFGDLEPKEGNPVEVGVMGIITADSPETCSEIGKLINPFLLHHPLTKEEELPSFAFPYSPAQSDRGALYEFCLNHVMELDDPMAAFRLDVTEV